MRQQVNLYQEALRPKRILWSSKQFAKGVVLVISIMLILDAFGYWQNWSQKRLLVSAEQALKAKQAELKVTETKYPRPQEDQRLRERVAHLGDELLQKQRIVSILSEGAYGNTHGFADYLTSLSRQHVDGIWLTRIALNKGGRQLSLSGGALKPELVPQLLQRLGGEPSFAGKEFKTFLLSRANKSASWINFNLDTEAGSEPKP